jgi:hypothetical protein
MTNKWRSGDIRGVSKKFGEWYQKTNKTEDTNKLTLLVFKIIAIIHNTLLARFIKLLETVNKGVFRNRSQNRCHTFLDCIWLTVMVYTCYTGSERFFYGARCIRCVRVSLRPKLKPLINPLTPELNPSAQRCLTRFFTGVFDSGTVHFVNICVKNQQTHQLFFQFINYVW